MHRFALPEMAGPSDTRTVKTYRRALGVVLVSVAALSQVQAAVAAPDSKSADEETGESSEVSELIERGIALRRAGDDTRALESFRQAERLAPASTRVQVHLAATYQALGNWESADRYLSLAIRDPEDPYVQKHQAVLAAARRTIDGHIGTLQLSGGPRGTEIKLNGRTVGTLPIEDTVRLEAGIYTLEARLPGHYPVTRSIALAGGTLVRESLALTPVEGGREEPAAVAETRGEAAASGGSNWLTWTFAGLAVAGGVGTVAAWATRERHVENWNDDGQCLRPGQTRGDVCAGEREDGDRAETWMWVAGAATGAFTVASVVSFWVNADDGKESGTALGCGVGFGQLSCSGRF
jgi:tetratricopeptide repeat protein/PEGA domain-containing protein